MRAIKRCPPATISGRSQNASITKTDAFAGSSYHIFSLPEVITTSFLFTSEWACKFTWAVIISLLEAPRVPHAYSVVSKTAVAASLPLLYC